MVQLFYCLQDNVISTPSTQGTILAGITRKSIIEIALKYDYQVTTLQCVSSMRIVYLFMIFFQRNNIILIYLELDGTKGEKPSVHEGNGLEIKRYIKMENLQINNSSPYCLLPLLPTCLPDGRKH